MCCARLQIRLQAQKEATRPGSGRGGGQPEQHKYSLNRCFCGQTKGQWDVFSNTNRTSNFAVSPT
jgi:hypothetical protein